MIEVVKTNTIRATWEHLYFLYPIFLKESPTIESIHKLIRQVGKDLKLTTRQVDLTLGQIYSTNWSTAKAFTEKIKVEVEQDMTTDILGNRKPVVIERRCLLPNNDYAFLDEFSQVPSVTVDMFMEHGKPWQQHIIQMDRRFKRLPGEVWYGEIMTYFLEDRNLPYEKANYDLFYDWLKNYDSHMRHRGKLGFILPDDRIPVK